MPLVEEKAGPIRWHSQWEIYGLDITQFLAKISRESGRQTEELRRRAPLDQLVYGWDRWDKNKRSASRDLLHLHYWLESLHNDGFVGGTGACYAGGRAG
eukprot:SAG11_NODE_8179_length_1051_cov_2.106092_3_plen_98_part_01